MFLCLFLISIDVFAVCFVCNIFAYLVCCVTFARVTAFLVILLPLLAFAFAFVLCLNFAKLSFIFTTHSSVHLMLFTVCLFFLHFICLVCCGGFARAAPFCVVFLLRIVA